MPDPDLKRRLPLFALPLVLPLLALLGVTPVGGFRMFAEPFRYRVTILEERHDGPVFDVPMHTLLPHMHRDARRVLTRSGQPRLGETQAELVGRDLESLAELACRLDARRAHVRVSMERWDVRGEPLDTRQVRHACARP